MTITQEAIQVAAVAAAMVEDLSATPPTRGERAPLGRRDRWWEPVEMVLGLIRTERQRQESRWGVQHHPAGEWLMILAEEVGELAGLVPEPADGSDPTAAIRRQLITAGDDARVWLDARRPSPPGATTGGH